MRRRVKVGVSDVLVVAAAALSGAAVTFTNDRPQLMVNCWEAALYVLEMGCVTLLPYCANTAMAS
jgi:hypothetical protein